MSTAATTVSDLRPAPHNLYFYRGDSVTLAFRLGEGDTSTPPVMVAAYDLTGVVLAAQIRASEDSSTILAEFTVTIGDQTDLAVRGVVGLALTTEQTMTLPTAARWDLQATWPGESVRTYLAGKVSTKKDTTRE